MENNQSLNPLSSDQSIEDWLSASEDRCFPNFDSERGEKPYPERYKELSHALLPIHNSVEKGAMAGDALKWFEKLRSSFLELEDGEEKKKRLNSLIEADPIVYLNNHGKGHIRKVIDTTTELLRYFDRGFISPYEVFLLLCAIQIHDVGNLFGREDHTVTSREVLEDKGKPFIPDSTERRVIENIARTHGGNFNGDPDTISTLDPSNEFFNIKVRLRVLAALLRFGDELADDSSRGDREAISLGAIPEPCLIYHHYSQSLHTVKLSRDSESGILEVRLVFEFDTNLANKKFPKGSKSKYLLDEIYDRTLKMERERRYCMRFLRPCISIDKISVSINITNSQNSMQHDRINYTLEENGYPNEPISGSIKDIKSNLRTGEEELIHLKSIWNSNANFNAE